MQLYQFLICLALTFAGLGLFRQYSVPARKLGLLSFWIASGLGAYFLTEKVGWGIFVLLLWILIPLTEVVVVLRKLRLPKTRAFNDAIPPMEEFPSLRDVTQEFQEQGFIKVDDCDLTPHFHETYYRLFYHREHPTHGVIGFVSQGDIGFSFHAFFSEQPDGQIWLTWDYPMTYGLKTPPHIAIYRVADAPPVETLWKEHQSFLEINGVKTSDLVTTTTMEEVRDRLSRALHRQLEYNIHEGILLEEEGHDPFHLRYTWRGTWFVARQMMRDLFSWN